MIALACASSQFLYTYLTFSLQATVQNVINLSLKWQSLNGSCLGTQDRTVALTYNNLAINIILIPERCN